MESVEDELQEFLSNGLSTVTLKSSRKFISSWNAFKKLAADMDQYITPVEPMEVKSPFASEEFDKMWKRWKEYLSEQHGQLMRTRSEVSALEYLDKISKSEEKKAIYILRYAMANRYRNFFEIEEKDTKKPAKDDTGSSFG
jgi:DNA repair photolyase